MARIADVVIAVPRHVDRKQTGRRPERRRQWSRELRPRDGQHPEGGHLRGVRRGVEHGEPGVIEQVDNPAVLPNHGVSLVAAEGQRGHVGRLAPLLLIAWMRYSLSHSDHEPSALIFQRA